MAYRHERVFVYGTLRRGEPNHWLLQGSRFLGEHRAGPGFVMVDLGTCPGVIPDGEGSVQGEVYRVDGKTLRRLDRLEAYPVVYTREEIETPFGRAWIYLHRHARGRTGVIASGDWLDRGRALGRRRVPRRLLR